MNKRPGASLPGLPRSSKLSPADAIVASAAALAAELGVPERELAASCMRLAVTIATKQNDPDGWLAILTGQIKEKQ
ncbi:hypothetical protein MRS76_24330 [Rhizobiaceae bacterium n13]|uniref:hypothetical protein n=1 Tax=Ferirhizobium litorale TaxID=2927786 RepID=UPI0024B2B705|nr:hypothetical protein [Fererhizobium litorale]MDI7865048.1 hypothetical protein [Fererhizobium litorale]